MAGIYRLLVSKIKENLKVMEIKLVSCKMKSDT